MINVPSSFGLVYLVTTESMTPQGQWKWKRNEKMLKDDFYMRKKIKSPSTKSLLDSRQIKVDEKAVLKNRTFWSYFLLAVLKRLQVIQSLYQTTKKFWTNVTLVLQTSQQKFSMKWCFSASLVFKRCAIGHFLCCPQGIQLVSAAKLWGIIGREKCLLCLCKADRHVFFTVLNMTSKVISWRDHLKALIPPLPAVTCWFFHLHSGPESAPQRSGAQVYLQEPSLGQITGVSAALYSALWNEMKVKLGPI